MISLNFSAIKTAIVITLIACITQTAHSQERLILHIHNNDTDTLTFSEIDHREKFPDKQSLFRELLNIRLTLFDQGYIAARIDSTIENGDTLNAYLTMDKKYELAYLGKGNIETEVWKHLVTKRDFMSFQVFKYNEITKLFGKLISYYENRGYPFVSVGMDSITINNNIISAKLDLEKSEKVEIDSIIIKGDIITRKGYIYNYLNIKPGDLYNESIIRKISKRIEEVPFMEEKKPFEVSFTENGAWIYLYPEKKRASRFDGILGVMPNNETTGKIMITGDVSLMLNNAFRWGEMIDFNWRKIEQNTQDLKFRFIYPFIFSSPFVIDYDFSLLKKDTLYYTVNNIIGLQYHFSGNNYLKVFADYRNSNLISTYGLDYATVLPVYADIKTRLYGLNYHLTKFDYLYNPMRGFHLDMKASAGNKTIKKNENLPEELYDDIELTSAQYTFSSDIGIFIPLARKTTVWLRSQSAYINNENLFENELFRIGGMRILRGFDEESIYASLYSVYTVELRYLFEKNSFFNFFWNGAYYEKKGRYESIFDSPFGFGAGLNFETKAGIFSINYALGKQFDNPIDLRSAKIHFGFVNSF